MFRSGGGFDSGPWADLMDKFREKKKTTSDEPR